MAGAVSAQQVCLLIHRDEKRCLGLCVFVCVHTLVSAAEVCGVFREKSRLTPSLPPSLTGGQRAAGRADECCRSWQPCAGPGPGADAPPDHATLCQTVGCSAARPFPSTTSHH